ASEQRAAARGGMDGARATRVRGAGRAGAAGRRRDRQRLDGHGGRPRAAPRGRFRGAAPRAGTTRLSGPGPSGSGRRYRPDPPEQAEGVPVDPFLGEPAVDDPAQQLPCRSILRSNPCTALRYPATRCVKPSGPFSWSGLSGSWLTWSEANSSSTVAQFAPFEISSNCPRTGILFSSVPSCALPRGSGGTPRFAAQAHQGGHEG